MSLSPSDNYTGASHLGDVKENWVFQLFNQDSYLSFDGTDDHINLGSVTSGSTSIAFTSTTKMSACGWIKFPTLGAVEYVFQNGTNNTAWFGVTILKDASNRLGVLWGDGTGTADTDYELMYGDGTFAADTWTFFAITTDFSTTTTNTKMWLGVGSTLTAQTIANTGTSGGTNPIYKSSPPKGIARFGLSKVSSDTYAEFDIKNLGLWNGELDSTNVTALFNSGTFLSFDEDSGNYDESSNLKGYWEFTNGENFAQDLTENIETGTITGATYKGFLPLAMRDTTIDNVFYHGVVKSNPSIRSSINLLKSTAKTGNVSLGLINAKYQGDDLSKELFLGSNTYYNRTVKAYSQLNEMNTIAECLQLYHGRLTDISHDDSSIKLSIVQKSTWDNKTVPTVKSAKGNYFPIVYGNFTKNSSTYGATAYYQTLGKTVFPVEVDRSSFYYECLLHKDIGSTDTELHYYEEGIDSFLPMENTNDAEAYEGGYAVKTDWTLKRHIKFKPLFAVKRTFGSDVGNVFDGTANQTISDNYASISMDTASAGTSTSGHKDNNYSIPSFDDPPDTTSSSNNHGLTIEVRWDMTGFYGSTGNSAGLTINKIEIYNQSRYATGNLTDTMSDGTRFATNGYIDKVNTATGSGASTSLTETTSTSSGSATATEFSAYPYDNGLSIRAKRTVTSSTDGSGSASSAIFGTLRVADVRCTGTFKIDRSNSTTDSSSRVRSVKKLYSGVDGLPASWDGGAIPLGHDAHRDMLIRYAGMPTIEPENWTALVADRSSWSIRYWLHKEMDLKKLLEKIQYEFGFIHKIDPSGKSKYIWVHGTGSNNALQASDVAVTLKKSDISSLQITTTPISDIETKTIINTQRHAATDKYITSTTTTNSTLRKKYNIKSKENTLTINLDALTVTPSANPSSIANKQNDFSTYYYQINGDAKLLIDCQVVNLQKGLLLETGDVVKFDDMPVNPFGSDWSEYFIVTDLIRSAGKVKIKVREIG